MAGTNQPLDTNFEVTIGQTLTVYVKDGDVELKEDGDTMSLFNASNEAYQLTHPSSANYQFAKITGSPVVTIWIE